MRRRIAVLANGWGYEYLCELVTGLCEEARKENIDVFSFISFATNHSSINGMDAEANIFRLFRPEDFDGAVILANSFNCDEEMNCVYDAVMQAKLPAVCVEYALDGISSVTSDNYSGMYDLAKHIVEEHHAERVMYIGGPKGHLESNLRLKAVQDVMTENGLILPEENIIYGDWAKDACVKLFEEWCGRYKELPDAVICANDIMAMAICNYVRKIGRNVPEDVIVTGYDYLTVGQEYEPSLSSVSHEWGSMSGYAVKSLLDKMQGNNTVTEDVIKTRFMPGGSCGCCSQENGYRWLGREAAMKSRRHSKFDRMQMDMHFRHIYSATRKTEDAKDLFASFNRIFEGEHWVEGDGFTVGLEREFFNIMPEDENLRTCGYNENMDIICSLRNGSPREHRIMSYKEAVFGVVEEKQEPGHYIFITLSSENKTYGFAMLNRGIDIVLDNDLYSWTRHVNQVLEQIRRNFTIADLTRKLTKMSVTDVLTGVYNRAGCEQIAYPQLQKWVDEGRTGVLVIADVDKMKTINDQHGHASGDMALRTVASVLKSSVPEEWIVSRYGGDEFMAGGYIEENVDMQSILKEIETRLKMEIERRRLAFELNVSVGYVLLNPGESQIDFEKSFQMADVQMYAMKAKHHGEEK